MSDLRWPLLALACWAAALGSSHGGTPARPWPRSVAVEVDFVEPPGSAVLREELRRRIVPAITQVGCMRAVALSDTSGMPDADLAFRVLLHDVAEELEYGMSLAERDSPQRAPEISPDYVARAETSVVLELRTAPPESLLVRSDRVRLAVTRQPMLRENSQEIVRGELMDGVARQAASFLCKGTEQKLARQIARARESAE